MLPLLQHSISFQTFPFTLHKNYKKATSGLGWDWQAWLPKRNSRSFHLLVAVKRDSEFEVDPAKAREALRKLDEQIESLATKPRNPPNIKAPDLNRVRELPQAEIEIPGPFLVSLGTALIIFTIFYNIFFLTVIKPSVDGPATYENIKFAIEAENTALSQ